MGQVTQTYGPVLSVPLPRVLLPPILLGNLRKWMKVLQFKKNVYNAHGGQLLNQEGERFIRGKPPGHTVENREAD